MSNSSEADWPRLHGALHVTCAFLDRVGISYAVIGGIAVAVWGEPRATFDVDLVALTQSEQGDDLYAAIAAGSPFLSAPELLSLPPSTRILRAHLTGRQAAETSVILVDFIFLDPAFTRSVVDRRIRVQIEGVSIAVSSPEDLILIKLHAGRVKDIEDIKGILVHQRDFLDRLYVDQWAERLGCTHRWHEASRLFEE
jgi:predicted nucleotidyltransferase